jgi:hypothetical protein
VLVESAENGNNVVSSEENNQERNEEKKIERKQISFDLCANLPKKLKMQAILQVKNIYLLIKEALYWNELRK